MDVETKIIDLLKQVDSKEIIQRPKFTQAINSASHVLIKQTLLELLDHEVTVNTLKEIAKAGKSPLKVAFAMCILKAIQNGDVKALSQVMDLLVTPVVKETKFKLFD